jgi:hypothetical protein
MKKAQAPVFIQREFLCFYFGRALPNVKLRGFIQSWVFNMRVSERLGSLVFIQKHFSKEFSSYPGGISAHRSSSTHIILVAGTCSAHGINP